MNSKFWLETWRAATSLELRYVCFNWPLPNACYTWHHISHIPQLPFYPVVRLHFSLFPTFAFHIGALWLWLGLILGSGFKCNRYELASWVIWECKVISRGCWCAVSECLLWDMSCQRYQQSIILLLLLLLALQPTVSFSLLHSWGFLDHTQWHITVGRTPLDKWSARHRDLYLTTHNIYKRQTSMPLVGFKPATPASDRPQTLALNCSATGIGIILLLMKFKWGTTILILVSRCYCTEQCYIGIDMQIE